MIVKYDASPLPLAPVDIAASDEGAVAHSLRILSTVYNYNHWIYNLLRDYVGSNVLEVGAGIGNMTRFLLYVDSLTCLEPAPEYRDYLSSRLADHRNVSLSAHRIEECPSEGAAKGAFDTVVCLNVLEHIEDDIAALKAMGEVLGDQGRAIIVVPALPAIYGELDHAMGHCRRYMKGSLARRMRTAGFKIEHARYFNLPGVLGWWWQGRLLKRSKIPERGTRLFDKLVPFVSAAERLCPAALGQSLIMVGKKQ